MPDTSTIIDAASVDNRVFVLKEDGKKMYWQEYLPEDNVYEDASTPCPSAASDKYQASAIISGKIYMVKEEGTKEILVYDAYADERSQISDMNLVKQGSVLAACGNDLYSIGGEMAGFGVLDVVEQYTVKVQTITKDMLIKKGEAYELQITAGNLKKGQAKTVTVSFNPEELQIQNVSSFEVDQVLREGVDGVTLLKYQPKNGVLVLKLEGSLERGRSYDISVYPCGGQSGWKDKGRDRVDGEIGYSYIDCEEKGFRIYEKDKTDIIWGGYRYYDN